MWQIKGSSSLILTPTRVQVPVGVPVRVADVHPEPSRQLSDGRGAHPGGAAAERTQQQEEQEEEERYISPSPHDVYESENV